VPSLRKFNEGKACDAIVRRIEAREFETRADKAANRRRGEGAERASEPEFKSRSRNYQGKVQSEELAVSVFLL